MDMSKIQRALGFIEGVCAGLKDREAELIEEAVNEIDCELETDLGSAGDTAIHGEDPRSDNMAYTSGQMDELVERLCRHYDHYKQGRCQNHSVVCSDCKKAAELIIRLRLIIEDQEYAASAERP